MCDKKLGQGMPKICIPIVEETQTGILQAARNLCDSAADLVEWRADYYEDLQDADKLRETIQALGRTLSGKPLLFTVRTRPEGGEIQISFEDYTELLIMAAECAEITYIDVEMFCGSRGQVMDLWSEMDHPCHEPVKKLVRKLCQNVTVIGSYHDFEQTPPVSEITRRLIVMHEMGADIPKMAVMPQQRKDVLDLMTATWEARQQLDPVPVITMSMGSMGLISRVAGESFGSAVTFGCMGKSSAPGQIEAEQLKSVLTILHENN